MGESKTWPKFTVTGPGGACGHQHETVEKATSCAENLAQRHRGQDVLVRERHQDGSAATLATVTHE